MEKKGVKKVAKITIVSSDHFDKERDNISKENNLVRCPSCGKLVSKVSEDGFTLQHRGLSSVIHGSVDVRCPECDTVINIQ